MSLWLWVSLIGIALTCSDGNRNCLACREGQCLLCVDALLASGGCAPLAYRVKNCLFYAKDGECLGCALGYFLTTENKCDVIAQEGCLELHRFQVCTMCRGQMRLRNGTCDSNSLCETVNCGICSVDKLSREVCFRCKEGFVLRVTEDSRTICAMGPDEPAGCWVGGPDGGKGCQICEIGYFMQDGECAKTDAYYFKDSAA